MYESTEKIFRKDCVIAGAGADFLLLLDGVVDVGEAALAAVLTIEMSRLLKQKFS
jgi:hypothetical protein